MAALSVTHHTACRPVRCFAELGNRSRSPLAQKAERAATLTRKRFPGRR